MEMELAFLKRRAAEERLAASITTNPKARDVHFDLALLYEARIRLLGEVTSISDAPVSTLGTAA